MSEELLYIANSKQVIMTNDKRKKYKHCLPISRFNFFWKISKQQDQQYHMQYQYCSCVLIMGFSYSSAYCCITLQQQVPRKTRNKLGVHVLRCVLHIFFFFQSLLVSHSYKPHGSGLGTRGILFCFFFPIILPCLTLTYLLAQGLA